MTDHFIDNADVAEALHMTGEFAEVQVDDALSGPYEDIGELIEKAGLEDSSGLRRNLITIIADEAYGDFARILKITEDEAKGFRSKLVEAYGNPYDGAGTECSSEQN